MFHSSSFLQRCLAIPIDKRREHITSRFSYLVLLTFPLEGRSRKNKEMIKKITIVLALLFMCTGIYAQTKNISVGFVPYGHSYEYGNCLKYGVTLDYERRFSDLSGNAGGLTLSGTYFYGNFPKDNHSFSFNVGDKNLISSNNYLLEESDINLNDEAETTNSTPQGEELNKGLMVKNSSPLTNVFKSNSMKKINIFIDVTV